MSRPSPLWGLLLCSVLSGVASVPAGAQTGRLRLYVETAEVTQQPGRPAPPPPLLQDNVLLLPVRLVFERLGARIEWDEETDTFTAWLPGVRVILQLGRAMVTVNDEDLEMGSPPPVHQGTMYLPDGVWQRILPVETRLREDEGAVELSYRWEPRLVTIAELAEFPGFFRARSVIVEGEYRGWRAKGLEGPVTSGPSARHRGDWIIADDTGGIYVNGHEPEGLDSLQRPGPRVRVTGLGAVSESGVPYLKAERVDRL